MQEGTVSVSAGMERPLWAALLLAFILAQPASSSVFSSSCLDTVAGKGQYTVYSFYYVIHYH